jgi:hypothetical protein
MRLVVNCDSRTCVKIKRSVVFAVVFFLLEGWACLGADITSAGIYSMGVTYYCDEWVVGSGANRFGLGRREFSTDSAGYVISAERIPGSRPGDTLHRESCIYLGRISFYVPLPRIAVLFLGGGLILVFALLLAGIQPLLWLRHQD